MLDPDPLFLLDEFEVLNKMYAIKIEDYIEFIGQKYGNTVGEVFRDFYIIVSDKLN